MTNICKCCGNELTELKCSYCGYSNDVITFDDSAEEIIKKNMVAYKRDLINRIKDFSIDGYIYKWNNQTNKLDFLGNKKIIIADGLDCFNNIIWSEKVFGQDIDDVFSEKSVNITYSSNGKSICTTVNLKPVQCDDFWEIGVEIKDDLMLYIYLGNISTNTIAGPIALEFANI